MHRPFKAGEVLTHLTFCHRTFKVLFLTLMAEYSCLSSLLNSLSANESPRFKGHTQLCNSARQGLGITLQTLEVFL